MSNKLTAQQLGRRLGYGLKLMFEKSGRIIELKGVEDSPVTIQCVDEQNLYDLSIWNFKPILFPLSYLTKEITIKGCNDDKPFVPIERLMQDFSDHHDFLAEIWEENDKYMLGTPVLWPYELVERLISWHFLIDEPEGSYVPVTDEFNLYGV